MSASQRPWSDAEIARDVLKIVSDSARAEKLVRAILGGDRRFNRDSGLWQVRATPMPGMAELRYTLAEAPPASGLPLPPFLVLRGYEPERRVGEEIVRVAMDGKGLRAALPLLEDRVLASLAAGPVRRFLHMIEHVHAFPSPVERILDLGAALRAFDGPQPARRDPDPAAASGNGIEDPLEEGERALAWLLRHHGAATWTEIQGATARLIEGVAVNTTRFRFGPARLEEVPAGPGVYRFLGEEGVVLYVGKSLDLRRRIAEYFRPLAPDHKRRAALLAEVRDLEWEETPSELEALLLESESIRALRPAHNQKVETHPLGEEPPLPGEDLLFVVSEGPREEVSVFLLRGGEPWARGRLGREPEAAEGAAAAIARSWCAGTIDGAAGLRPLEPPERLLVLRYLRLFGDRVDRIRRLDHPEEPALAAALAELAARPRPDAEPWWMRSSPSSLAP
jgi:hypothetical protein